MTPELILEGIGKERYTFDLVWAALLWRKSGFAMRNFWRAVGGYHVRVDELIQEHERFTP